MFSFEGLRYALSYNFWASAMLPWFSTYEASFLQMNYSLSGAIDLAILRAANQSYKSILMSRARDGFEDFPKTS